MLYFSLLEEKSPCKNKYETCISEGDNFARELFALAKVSFSLELKNVLMKRKILIILL